MQKKIIALAIAAAFSAPAFADTTVYGVVDAAVAHVSADKLKSDMQVLSGGLSASRLGVKSVQDAGDMKVVAVLEFGLDTASAQGATKDSTGKDINSGSGIGAARQQMLALAGGFGTVAAGYLQTTGYDWAVKFDPTAGSAVSPLQNVTAGSTFLIGSAALGARAQRALAYISPDMSGVTVAVNYSTSLTGLGNLGQADAGVGSTPDNKTTAMLLSATYNAGPLSVGGVYASATIGQDFFKALTSGLTEATTLSATDMALGASYDFGVAKLFGTYQTSKTGTNNVVVKAGTNKAMSLSVVAPVGPGAVALSYAKNTIDASSTISTAIFGSPGANGEMNASAVTVAWLQGLSKTTTLYAAYSKVSEGKDTSQYSVLAGKLAGVKECGSSVIAVGLNNKF